MPVGVARQVEYWLQKYAPNVEIKLTPLALTREQVVDLPPAQDSDQRRG